MTESFQIRPPNFAAIVDKNRHGPALLSSLGPFHPFSVVEVENALDMGAAIIDIRSQTAFGAAFMNGAVNIGDMALGPWPNPMVNVERGSLVDFEAGRLGHTDIGLSPVILNAGRNIGRVAALTGSVVGDFSAGADTGHTVVVYSVKVTGSVRDFILDWRVIMNARSDEGVNVLLGREIQIGYWILRHGD